MFSGQRTGEIYIFLENICLSISLSPCITEQNTQVIQVGEQKDLCGSRLRPGRSWNKQRVTAYGEMHCSVCSHRCYLRHIWNDDGELNTTRNTRTRGLEHSSVLPRTASRCIDETAHCRHAIGPQSQKEKKTTPLIAIHGCFLGPND